MRFFARLFLVILLSLGLLLPRVSVMLAEVTGAQRVLLCSGESMVVLSLTDAGEAHSLPHDTPCGLIAVDLPQAAPLLLGTNLPRALRLTRRGTGISGPLRAVRRHRARAPPALG